MTDWEFHSGMLSEAILIGTSKYDHLPQIPAAINSLAAMHQLLISDLCLWKRSQVTVIENPSEPAGLGSQLLNTYGKARDVALFYYVGHGYRDEEQELCLTLRGSQDFDGPHIASSSLPFSVVKRALRASKAAVKIVILDCCKSGISGNESDLYKAASGVYILAATTKYGTAKFDEAPGGLTNFTRHFVSVVEQGIASDSEGLTLDAIAGQVCRSLSAAGLDPPTDVRQNLHGYTFARNRAFRPKPHIKFDNWYLYDIPPPHQDAATCVAFSPSGNFLATGSADGTVVVHKISLDAKCSVVEKVGELNSERMASAQRGTERARRVGPRKERSFAGDVAVELAFELSTQLMGYQRIVTGIAFSPRAVESGVNELALSGGRKGLLFWTGKGALPDAGINQLRHVLPVFSSTGAFLVSVHQLPFKSKLKWWNEKRSVIHSTDSHERICAVASSPSDEEVFACGYEDGTVRLWSFSTRQVISPRMQGDVGVSILSLSFSPDGRSLAAANQDGLVSLWSVAGTSTRLFICNSSGQISMEDTCRLPSRQRLVGESAGISCIAYSPDGAWFATGDWDGCVRLWDPSTSEEVGQELFHRPSNASSERLTRKITALTFSPDSNLLAAVNENGQMFIWKKIARQTTVSDDS